MVPVDYRWQKCPSGGAVSDPCVYKVLAVAGTAHSRFAYTDSVTAACIATPSSPRAIWLILLGFATIDKDKQSCM